MKARDLKVGQVVKFSSAKEPIKITHLKVLGEWLGVSGVRTLSGVRKRKFSMRLEDDVQVIRDA